MSDWLTASSSLFHSAPSCWRTITEERSRQSPLNLRLYSSAAASWSARSASSHAQFDKLAKPPVRRLLIRPVRPNQSDVQRGHLPGQFGVLERIAPRQVFRQAPRQVRHAIRANGVQSRRKEV